MERLIRLSFITEYLTLNKKATAEELASKLNVSKKTIYRDIELLSSMEVPIYMQPGRRGGIHILESYVISKKLINDEEQMDILSALKTVEATEISNENMLSMKLSSVFQKESIPSFNIDFSGWGKDTEKKKLDMITLSQKQRQEIQFSYTNSQGIYSKRRAIVVEVNFKKNAWYFDAYCLDKNENRTFKLSRAHEITLGKEYDSATLEMVSKLKKDKMNLLKLTIKVKKSNLVRIQEDIKVMNITDIDSDTVLIETSQPEGDWLIHYLLSFGSSIEVMSPKSIRDKIIEEVLLMKNIY